VKTTHLFEAKNGEARVKELFMDLQDVVDGHCKLVLHIIDRLLLPKYKNGQFFGTGTVPQYRGTVFVSIAKLELGKIVIIVWDLIMDEKSR
jgi:hypothetical protein